MKFIMMHWVIKSFKFIMSKNNVKFLGLNRAGRIAILLLVLATSSFTHAQEQGEGGFVIDEIIAKVDNYIVLKSELDRAYQDYLANGGSQSEEARCQYLGLLIRNKLMMAKAEIDSVVVLDAEVDLNTSNRMDMILAQSGKTAEEMEQIYGKTMEQIQAELREQIREQMIIREMESTISQDITVTPAEVKRFFNKIPKDSLPFFSAELEVGQIVRKAKVSAAQKEETRLKLIGIRNQILSGESFAELARKHSDDPSAQYNAGEMGWSARGRMVPEFEAMAFKLKPGELSMPFETDFGFHILQLIERRGNEFNSRHILLTPTPSENDLKDAERYLDSLRTLVTVEKASFEKLAKEYSDDPETKGNGGFFTDANGSMKIAVDELDPVVFFKLDSMNVGEISNPLTYRTDDQKSAVRIIYYKSRVRAHEASLKDDWQRIYGAALNEKKDKALQKWFEEARLDVFINIDPAYDFCGILDQ